MRNVDVRSFDDEADMLLAWVELMRDIDPDIVLGYNIFGFDFDFLYTRATELFGTDVESCFCRLGRIDGLASAMRNDKLSSSALGDNELKYLDMHGRVTIDLMKVVQRDHRLDSYRLDSVAAHFMGLNKHDVSPNEIFRLQRGTSADRRIIAEYCVQDCVLCNQLTAKLEIVANNVGMANVCSVPLSYIFMRGQGIKIFSLVAKQSREDGLLIPVIRTGGGAIDRNRRGGDGSNNNGGGVDGNGGEEDEEEGYEGAIVLEPETGMYLDDPVSVLDYNSLYPSSMISHNISHDSLVIDAAYANVPGVDYVDVTYDLYEGKGDEKRKVGEHLCRFAQVPSVLPRILQRLLAARKATRKKAEFVCADVGGARIQGEWDAARRTIDGIDVPNDVPVRPAYDAFQRAVLDGMQLAYKVTANSLYGQMGARTSKLYLRDVAASTTAVGRSMIMLAKDFIEQKCGGRVVYGDTDSIFVVFRNEGSGRDALASSIRQGQAASRGIKPLLRPPHNLEYEKTLFPLILLSKKRYVGLLYEDDPDAKPKQKSMGIALKRRDYAPVVKRIYGGVIDIILRDRDIPKAVSFLKNSLQDLADGKMDLSELVISKTLRSFYKVPHQIAHWVLSRRMFERDPGSAPQVNDRIPYVFVETSKKNALMGDRIEHVDFVRKHLGTGAVRVDAKTYIENQVREPCLQLLSIALERIPGYAHNPALSGSAAMDALIKDKNGDVKKARKRLDALRENEVDRLVFQPVLSRPMIRQRNNRCNGQREINDFFSPLCHKK